MKTYNCINCGTENLFGHSKSNKYCNNQCQADFQYNQYIAAWKAGTEDGRKGKLQTSGYVVRYVLAKQNYKCASCGIDKHNGLPIVLELDHIDGNYTNNTEQNLRCLCPNCHSQTPTYKSKNKGQGRQNR